MHTSKGRGRFSRRHAVSELIATLLLIAIAVAAAILVYGFATGLFSHLTAGGGPSAFVTASGQMTVPGSTGPSAVLTLNLRNQGSQSIDGIVVACQQPPFGSYNCNGIASEMFYNGGKVTPLNLLPVNALASGSVVVNATSTFSAGVSYAVELTVTFVSGSSQIVVVSVNSKS